MEIAVTLEPVAEGGYRARCGDPIPLVATGPTREAALAELQQMLDDRAGRKELVFLQLRVPGIVLPSKPIWPDDEITRDWLEGIAEYRRSVDEADRQWLEEESAKKWFHNRQLGWFFL